MWEPLLHIPDLEEAHHCTYDQPMRPWERERAARAKRLRMRVLLSVACVLLVTATALVLLA